MGHDLPSCSWGCGAELWGWGWPQDLSCSIPVGDGSVTASDGLLTEECAFDDIGHLGALNDDLQWAV